MRRQNLFVMNLREAASADVAGSVHASLRSVLMLENMSESQAFNASRTVSGRKSIWLTNALLSPTVPLNIKDCIQDRVGQPHGQP